MNGRRVELDQVVKAPVERVWDVLTDIAHADQTLSGVTHVELITEGPYRVGTRWRETRRMFGTEATEQLQVTVVERPTRTVIEAHSSGVHHVTEFTLVPSAADATRLAVSLTAVQRQASPLHKALWRLFGRLGVKTTEKVLAKDLHDIAARAERP